MDKVAHGYNSKQGWGRLQRLNFPPLKPARIITTRVEPTTDVIFACVCVGPKFPAHYVYRLKSMIARNLPTSQTWRFACITDRHDLELEPHEIIRPRRNLPGWYSKINLFDPQAFPAGTRVIYLDLDVVVTGSLNDFVGATEDFIMIREFNAKPEAANNSSLMAWSAGNYTTEIYDKFQDDWMERSWGDQECIWTIMGNERIWNWPEAWVRSYKWHGRSGVPKSCRVMVFHGDPKPDAVKEKWVNELWR